MEKQFEIIRKTRGALLSIIDGLTLQQLNKIPEGFNNNIIWNIGHVVAAQQGICYRRAGLPLLIDEALFEKYKPGSKPDGAVDENELEQIKGLVRTTIDDLHRDFEANEFSAYPSWTTRYGVDVTNINDAILFLSFHDGVHMGYCMALKRCVSMEKQLS